MRRFLVDRTNIENVNVVQPEAEVDVADEFNSNEIVRDLGLRKQIHLYAPDIQDEVRRAYVLKGPMQPKLTSFSRTPFGSATRTFSKSWYNKYTWIEYSELKDAIYCFYFFLFKQPGRAEHFSYRVFTKERFKDWKHASQGLKIILVVMIVCTIDVSSTMMIIRIKDKDHGKINFCKLLLNITGSHFAIFSTTVKIISHLFII